MNLQIVTILPIQMENIKDTVLKFLRINNLVDNLTGYVEARVKLMKIEIREDVANVLSKGLVHITMFFFAFLFLLFVSIGLANYINTLFVDSFTGYWILSGFYFLIFLILLIFRKSINQQFSKYFGEMIKKQEPQE